MYAMKFFWYICQSVRYQLYNLYNSVRLIRKGLARQSREIEGGIFRKKGKNLVHRRAVCVFFHWPTEKCSTKPILLSSSRVTCLPFSSFANPIKSQRPAREPFGRVTFFFRYIYVRRIYPSPSVAFEPPSINNENGNEALLLSRHFKLRRRRTTNDERVIIFFLLFSLSLIKRKMRLNNSKSERGARKRN